MRPMNAQKWLKAKTGMRLVLFASMLLLSSCAQYCGGIGDLSEARRIRGLEDSPKVRTCSNAFYYGAIWENVDRLKAYQESEWIVQVWTTKRTYLSEDDYDSQSGSYVFDYSAEFQQLQDLLRLHEIEMIDNQNDWALLLRGQPEQILDLLEDSCQLQAFDLTGFHCDCAPQMCEQASFCEMTYSLYDESFGAS